MSLQIRNDLLSSMEHRKRCSAESPFTTHFHYVETDAMQLNAEAFSLQHKWLECHESESKYEQIKISHFIECSLNKREFSPMVVSKM